VARGWLSSRLRPAEFELADYMESEDVIRETNWRREEERDRGSSGSREQGRALLLAATAFFVFACPAARGSASNLNN
jgi:hypothetical protein